MRLKIALSFFALFVYAALSAQKNVSLTSPNGKLVFTLRQTEGKATYSVRYKNDLLIANSALQLVFEDDTKAAPLPVRQPVFSEVKEQYSLHAGKAKNVKSHYKQVIVGLMNNNYQVNLEVRAFNDGLAFRYVLPEQQKDSYKLKEELTEFKFATDPIVKTLLLPNFTSSHEGLYTTTLLSKLKADTLMDMPTLFQFSGNIFMAITEAALLDYAGMYLTKRDGVVRGVLSPLPDQSGILVKATLPHKTPWRVLLISDRVGALIESNIITSLNEPTKMKDLSWIKPGSTTFPWWNGTIIPDSIKGGNNFETNKYYIDFCAKHDIAYHTIVEYGGHEWYTNNGEGYQPGSYVDITKPVEGLDMKMICDYAKQRNVGIRVWTHWKALYPQLDEAFAMFEKWGLSGLMVDFLDRDDQEMVNIQTEILEKAAKHRLHIQFHGSYKPTGINRTYPNELTREGTLNYEHHKWDNLVTAEADLDIVFTRMLAGSTDYHLGGFNALHFPNFVVQNFKPYVLGTRCHMLAMYVVLENYLPMVADYPDAYIGQPGFEILQKIPASWDETKVVAAKIDEYVSIARRKDAVWYVGTINNSKEREITIGFDFLPAGRFSAEVLSDGVGKRDNANYLTKQKIFVRKTSTMKIKMASEGGSVIVLTRVK